MTDGPTPLGDYLRARRELVAKLVATLPLPAFVEGRYFDVLAANPLATAFSPRLAVGGNRLRDVFLDPAERAFHPDWDAATAGVVAGFRQSVGTDTDDPRFIELVGELALASPRFRRTAQPPTNRHATRSDDGRVQPVPPVARTQSPQRASRRWAGDAR